VKQKFAWKIGLIVTVLAAVLFLFGKRSPFFRNDSTAKLNPPRKFSATDFLHVFPAKVGGKLKEIPEFVETVKLLERNPTKGHYLVFMFTDICMNCSGGKIIEIIQQIEQLNQEKGEHYRILVIMHDSFSPNDIANMSDQVRINSMIVSADPLLAAEWNRLLGKYPVHNGFNSIVLLINKDFVIEKMAFPLCKCLDAFLAELQLKFWE